MLRVAADENLDHRVVRGLRRRRSDLDIVRVQDVGLRTADDAAVLEWAAQEDRILLTHDLATIDRYAYERVLTGLPMPGVFKIRRSVPISEVIESVLYLAQCSHPGEWEGQVRYLPLR
jgi:hypothetical protein